VLVFRDALFEPGSIVFGSDVLKQHYPFEWYIREALRAGNLPLWNPYVFSGAPALSHPLYMLFYPPQMLLRLLPQNLAQSWAVALHLCLAGIGMFLLCRRLRIRPWISLTCALVYMLNSGMLLRVYAGQLRRVYALAWFPLAWLLISIALETGRAAALVGASVCLAMIILTGNPALPFYMVLFFGIYWLYVCWRMWSGRGSGRRIGRVTVRFFVVLALGLALSGIQIIPSAVLAGQISLGSGFSPSKANDLALSAHELLAILVPRFYTSPEKWKFYWELVPYMGVLFILVLPFLYVARARRSLANLLGTIALLSLAVAFGESLGLFSVLYSVFPPFRLIRIPPRALVLWIPAIVVLGGMGLQAVSGRSISRRRFSLGVRISAGTSLFVLGAAAGHWLNQTASLADRISSAGLLSVQLALIVLVSVLVVILFAARLIEQTRSVRLYLLLVLLALLGCLTGVLMLPAYLPLTGRVLVLGLMIPASILLLDLLYNHGPSPLSVAFLIGLVCLDLGLFGLIHVGTAAPPSFYEDERVVLRSAELSSFGRVLHAGGSPDKYILGHANHIDGYSQGILRGYDAFLRSNVQGSPTDTSYILSSDSTVDPEVLDFLGVQYIIKSKPSNDDELELVASQNGYYLYRNPSALPRAFVVYDVQVASAVEAALEALKADDFDYARSVVLPKAPDPEPGPPGQASVSIDEYLPTSGNLTIDVQTSQPGVLVLAEPYYIERRVWVDGQEQELLRANVGFIAVSLSAGLHKVELRYVPVSLYVGVGLSALAILGCAGVLLLSRAYSRRRNQTQRGTSIQWEDWDSGL
jgi:hypothetical protein